MLLLTVSGSVFAQNLFDKAKLDNYFGKLEENNKFMGSVAVAKNGEIIYTKSIGFADVENNVKAAEKSKYRIGSVSKSFTAVLVLKAVEEKKIDLDQTIEKWFPAIANSQKITIRHLLSHRSGIHDFTHDNDYLAWCTQPKTENEMLAIIEKGGSDFEPDSKADYSNSNYVLLTYILEKIFSKPYSDLLQEYIAKPIGLTDTYVFGKTNPNNNECRSYRFLGSWKVENETDWTVPMGAGAIVSTPTDLTKFADALFGGRLLTNESLEIMKTIKDDYGLGLFEIPFGGNIGLGHTGAIDGFISVYSHFADGNITYALISNGQNFKIGNINKAVLSAVFGKPYELPEFYNVASEDLDIYLGVYVSKKIGLDFIVTKEGNTLIGQIGDDAIPLEAVDKDKFNCDQIGATFEFNPKKNTMTLFQYGAKLVLRKKN
ncbi:MAG: beta-lactamase family protein [Bacteroidales bacterium]|nr:beta-lactamase family protein [Bacteroidales bacterium]